MSVSVTLNGVSYTIPNVRGETGWQTQVTAWIQSVSSNTLQKTGGTFTLTADINFGSSYGVTAKFFAATSYINLSEASAPSTPASGVISAYAKTDKNLYYKDSTGAERQLATGSSSGINYAAGTSSDFESSIGGWTTYADGSATPVDMTGGSPTATFTQSSSSPLRGTYSGLYTASGTIGQGVALAVTVPRADFAAPIEISFDYEIGTSSSFTDGDIAIWVYDVTNSQLIQPAPYLLPKCTGQEKFTAYFQSSSSATSYRVGIHQATANTGYTFKIDNVQIGPVKSNELGTIITDAQTYTPTLSTGAFGTNTNSFTWQRIGDSMRIVGKIAQTGAGTIGSGNYYLSIPTGFTIDTTKITPATNVYTNTVGSSSITGSTLAVSLGTTFAATSTSLGIGYVNASASGTVWGSSNQPLSDANVVVAFDATVPIQGWSSSSVTSSADYSTRIVAASYTTATGTISGSASVVKFTNKVVDTHAAYSTSTGQFTVPVAGYYRISTNLFLSFSATTANLEIDCYLIQTGATKLQTVTSLAASLTQGGVCGSIIVSCVAGDTLQVSCSSNTTSPAYQATTLNGVTFEKVSGPSQVLPSETVACRYTTVTAGSYASGATLLFDVKDYDSHGSSYSTSTGRFTAPIAGKYRVTAMTRMQAFAAAVGDSFGLTLAKNGSDTITLDNIIAQTTTSIVWPLGGSCEISLLAGDYISVSWGGISGSKSFSTNANLNHIEISRIGN